MRMFDFCYKAQLVDSLYQPQHMVVGLVKQKLWKNSDLDDICVPYFFSRFISSSTIILQ